MSCDIVTLQMKLQQAQKERSRNCSAANNQPPISLYKMHTAAVERARYLIESGQFSDEEVVRFSKLSPSEVESEKARFAEREESRRRYHLTGQMPREGGYYAIIQR